MAGHVPRCPLAGPVVGRNWWGCFGCFVVSWSFWAFRLLVFFWSLFCCLVVFCFWLLMLLVLPGRWARAALHSKAPKLINHEAFHHMPITTKRGKYRLFFSQAF
ncbi:hypothetical protein METBIDRAFT_145035 [Metschnikowia bicuspidata var. bicuspidata NRRL YB-4993]|uniref:Uncharacterized protein n=1 Tax=Metschnikowia bicuspidata var. bicuspidata NRRL YB-4993 TaxID=869754 RepID=A0A1A0HDQ5_9ASCO|nr:hypothetical protein METBIDRAFT_145035 [Metschnikowia bicuspidata var. bicuspidata NRRL YB-4993]OBA22027.1 hypothetical protein METBIDRAFT_145035 [Metschnikowia bicuspidata var. bicuspidata NRRL YB-4993]